MNALKKLQEYGQAFWLDYIRRDLITGGGLERLIDEDGLRGVTSNPTIFDKAISGSSDYDEQLQSLVVKNSKFAATDLFDQLEIQDIQNAADVFRPVYDQLKGADGFVSMEVPATIAHDTDLTIKEARRLWQAVNRPNVMIKVPATAEGILAIEELIAGGINVNITLMFSMAHYEAVANAYVRGLRRNKNPQNVSSVASFFVSRVDTKVDQALEKIATPEALALRGKIAIANSKLVYKRFKELFLGSSFDDLKRRGARVQRPLWASTSTKNPAYKDVLYIEELIGADTINTIPPATADAFRDHGKVQATLDEGLDEAQAQLNRLAKLGVDLNAIADQLLVEGIESFDKSMTELLKSLDDKRKVMLAPSVDRQELAVGPAQAALDERLAEWEKENFSRRLWANDYTLWSRTPVAELTDRMGWLTLPETMHDDVEALESFAEEIKNSGKRHIVLLGMGGSSLAPEVYQRTFGNASGYPELIVLDSTHPAAVREVESRIDPLRTLFLVSSKSGGTTETLSFFYYFWKLVGERSQQPGQNFVAITDPGTSLEKLAKERKFRRVFAGPVEVGGRYAALSVFGLVPAALIGVDIRRLLDEAWTMSEASAFCVGPKHCPSLALGAAIAELARAHRDKLTFIASRSVAAFPLWAEQLIAESTGKDGKGITPVADEPVGTPDNYGKDRVFVFMYIAGEDEQLEASVSALQVAGSPVVRIALHDKYDLGQEFIRWETAVAAAGSALGINPFNQPDVQLAKDLAKKVMSEQTAKKATSSSAEAEGSPVSVGGNELSGTLQNWIAQARVGDYISLQAYLPPTKEVTAALQELRQILRSKSRLATTMGYGPRFLHSTGQLHKGGPNSGLFLQLLDEPTADLEVPEASYSFGALIRAQAQGDFQALKQRGRRVVRLQLGSNIQNGLTQLLQSARTLKSELASGQSAA